jgi:hypothetical protein
MSKPKYECKPLLDKDFALWDSCIEQSERGSLFHQTCWLESFGRHVAVIGCYGSEELVGGMPLCYQQKAGLKIARPPYLTPYLGPVVFRVEGKRHRVLTLEKDIASSLIDYVTQHYDFVRMPLSLGCLDVQPFQQNGFEVDVRWHRMTSNCRRVGLGKSGVGMVC